MISNQENRAGLNSINNQDIDFRVLLSAYVKQWKWFVLSCILFLTGAFFNLRYTAPEYNISAQIMLVEQASSTPANQVLKELELLSEGESSDVSDIIEVIKSRTLMENVVKKLSLNIEYFSKGRIHELQLFKEPPIKVNFIEKDSVINLSKFDFGIEVVSSTKFDFFIGENVVHRGFLFGENLESPVGDIIITPNIKKISSFIKKKVDVRVRPVSVVAESYRNKLMISRGAGENSKIINISLNDAVKEKALLIIDTLIDEYNRVSIDEKNQKSKNAANFIDERINLIAKDLSDVDNKIERFKTSSKLTNITSETELYLNSSSKTEGDIALARTKLNSINYMRKYVDDGVLSLEPIPSNIGLSDSSINNLTSKYNELLNQRNYLLNGSTKQKNPIIIKLDQQLINLKQSLNQSLSNLSKTISFQINSLENRAAAISSKIYSVPGQVRETRNIEREQQIKESIYLFLLQKREEATISLTSTSPNTTIVDKAYVGNSGIPVSPRRSFTYIAALILGLIIPFLIIYIQGVLDNKIHNKEDLEKNIKGIPVLGEIPNLKGRREAKIIKRNDRSVLSESFRIIRTNFDYIKRSRHHVNYDNVVFITSTINGEGKSFFSMNMALTLASTDKRVLLIGADIRNPQTGIIIDNNNNNNNNKSNTIGLTEYLVDESVIIGEAINAHEINGNKIDVMLSGKVPPNPAELLMNNRMKALFDKVSDQYDYVIVDTAPSMLVTDTLLFSQYAGHTIYMTRADYTEKRILNFAKELHMDKKLNGMMLVVNDVKQSNFGYGARYGYYGTPEKKGFLSMFKKKAKA